MKVLRELLADYVSVYGFDYKAIRNRYCPLSDSDCKNDYREFMKLLEEERKKYEYQN